MPGPGRARGSTRATGSRSPWTPWSPGVQVHVIGPPTVTQHAAVAKERSTSPEYWQLYQGLAATGAFDPGAVEATAADERLIGPERWLVERLQAPQLRSLLRIVTALDHAMNN